jgi:ubiquinone/menaquinone biosynthesis C-methylase UbiE
MAPSSPDPAGAHRIHLSDSGSDDANRDYYDDFATRYEDERGGRRPGGYHDLIDDLEVAIVRRYATGKDVLEVGCGTGLLLARFAAFARSARGVDLSPGMLAHARQRGLDVLEASATELPFADGTFDVSCSFKVLAHVPEIERALAEMVRVVRPGGYVLAEFYNRFSMRALLKRYGPAGRVSDTRKEDAVYTRFDSPAEVVRMLPPNARLVGSRGVRILTPSAGALRVPVLGKLLVRAEHALSDSPLRSFGGFWVAIIQKQV